MDWDKALIIVGAALAVSEALSLIPKLKSNGIFQFIVNILKTFKALVAKKK